MTDNLTGIATAGLSRQTAAAISEAQSEPDWLRDRRLEAWRVFDYLPMPDGGRMEEWRRTDVSELDLGQFTPYQAGYRAEHPADLDAALTARLPVSTERGATVVQHDSSVVYRSVSQDLLDDGVIVLDLPAAARDHPDLLRQRFLTDIVQPEMSKFIALHGAFWSGGTLVYVPAGKRVRLPIDVSNWLSAPGLAAFGHLLLIAEPDSAVTVIERFASEDSRRAALASTVSEIWVGQGARVQHVTVQEWGRGVSAFARQRAVVERDAHFGSTVVSLGGSLWRGEIEAVLNGPGAEATMNGLVVGNRRQHLDHHTLQYHQAPHTRSELLYKGVLRDRARSVFVGKIVVPREAQQTESYQANRNLLLTERARADTQPVLEILANDVRCSHGATVGPLDEDQFFYLMARGIPREVAREMLVAGYVQPIIDHIPATDLPAQVQAAVAERVAGD